MKRTQTTTTKEYDTEGRLLREATETVEEEDTGYIYPQHPAWPYYSPTVMPTPFVYKPDVTCETGC